MGRQDCVNFMGGKCFSCGFDKYSGALEFHHLDPKEKDFELSKKYRKFNEEIKNELLKCVMLCSNCHKMVHGNIITLNKT